MDFVYEILWTKNKKKALKEVARDSVSLSNESLIISLLKPSSSLTNHRMITETEPKPIECDSLCGVEQSSLNHCELESRVSYKRATFNMKHSGPTGKENVDSNRKAIASSGILSLHNRNKSKEELNSSKTQSAIPMEKNTRRDIFHLKDRSKSSQKLIPLSKSSADMSGEQMAE